MENDYLLGGEGKMYHFYENAICFADDTVTARRTPERIPVSYVFQRLQYPNIYIPNRGAAYHFDFLPENSDEKTRLKKAVEEYNNYLDKLDSIDGFQAFFVGHDLCVSKKEIAEHWSEEVAETVFSKKAYSFDTNLQIRAGCLLDKTFPRRYSVQIEGEELFLPIGENANSYPSSCWKMQLMWNWVDNGHDFTISLWELLGEPTWQNGDDDEAPVSYGFDYYDQIRFEPPELQLVRSFSKLENLGYIKVVTIVPDKLDPFWEHFCKSDGSIDCAVVDPSFQKNKLVMEQILKLLWTPTDELKEKPYFLTTDQNIQVLSSVPGTLGGHKKLKIYGRLDCPSAARYLAKGQYAQNRVFFTDENTAISAGYRPCAICMPEAYKKWKEAQNK